MKNIKIKGARVNNLKNIDLDIPINKITSFIGPSGSGKTSIAFHTLFSESKRRFLNSFPTYLKFFSDRPAPVDVDTIEPVLPVFGLPQVNPVSGTRSSAADVMQITNDLQSLYASFSTHYCPDHLEELEAFNFDSYLEKELSKISIGQDEIFHIFISKEHFIEYFRHSPFPSRSIKSKRSKKIEEFNEEHELWEVIRFKYKSLGSLHKKLKNYLNKPIPLILFRVNDKKFHDLKIDNSKSCPKCNYKEETKLSPYYFSPYNALGACIECNGFGNKLIYDKEKYLDLNKSIKDGAIKMIESNRFGIHKKHFLDYVKKNKISTTKKVDELSDEFFDDLHEGSGSWVGLNKFFKYLESKKYKPPVRIYIRGIQKEQLCEVCEGSRINFLSHNFSFDKNPNLFYKDVWNNSISELLSLINTISKIDEKLFSQIIKKIKFTLELAESVGLGHLSIDRKAKSLSSGEYQRLLLLKYLTYQGTGGLFIFDEPSLGLDLKECEMLFKGFKSLVEQQNTVILIEHNPYLINESDHIIEMGPGAGKFGGEVIFTGQKKITINKELDIKSRPNQSKPKTIKVIDPALYGKTYKSFKIPINEFTCVYGPSGSGKTSAIINTLCVRILKDIGKYDGKIKAGEFTEIKNTNTFEDVIIIDSNLNRYSSRSSIGSLTGLVTIVRKNYLRTKEAAAMGLKDGHFSSNSVLGQCPECQGRGVKVVEMQFLEDVILTCEDCNGKKMKPLYANLSDGNRPFYEAVSAPLNEIVNDLTLTPKYKKIIEFMKLLNLDYLSLDRSIQSLSGGEKQRVYLLSKLTTKIENNLLVFENISFGLSFVEQSRLAVFLQNLSKTNTVILIDQSKLLQEASSHKIKF